MSTWIECTCDMCGAVIARTPSGGYELFNAHLSVCTGNAR